MLIIRINSKRIKMSSITVEKAICMLLPNFANVSYVQELILDKTCRLYYLARDMVTFQLLPYIQVDNLSDTNVRRLVEPVDSSKYISRDRDIQHLRSSFSGKLSVQLLGYDCFIGGSHIYIVNDNYRIACKYNHSRSDGDWHYVGNNILLCKESDKNSLWKYYGYKVEADGQVREFTCDKLMDLVYDITVLPCGLVYCDGFKKGQRKREPDWEYDGPYTMHKVINFMKEPPEVVETTSAIGDGRPWHFINDRGVKVCHKGHEGSDCRPRDRSSVIIGDWDDY